MQYNIQFSSVQSLSRVWLCDPMDRSTPGLPIHLIPEITQTHVHWVCDAIQPSNPPLLPPSIFPSIRVFSNESALHVRWPKYWSFSLKSFIHWKDWWILKWVVVIWMYIRVDSHSDVCLRSSHFLHVNYTTGKNIKGCSLTLAGRQLILA